MLARDSAGRRVSLLNDEQGHSTSNSTHHLSRSVFDRKSRYPDLDETTTMLRSHSDTSARSIQSSPRTPYLQRSDSYDSNATNDPISPVTPISDYGRQSTYSNTVSYEKDTQFDNRPFEDYEPFVHRPAPLDISMSTSHHSLPYTSHQDHSHSPSSLSGHSSSSLADPNNLTAAPKLKRYPCRYRDSHACTKSFTTSGHASRHSKIHTAEKAVKCTHPGCAKKFTRADNMKQHLETHNKNNRDRERTLTRPAGVQVQRPASRASTASLQIAAVREERREELYDHVSTTSTGGSEMSGSNSGCSPVMMQIDPQLTAMSMPLSPTHMQFASIPIRDSANRGLDALAAVAACQNLS